jgi:hypothetical protein
MNELRMKQDVVSSMPGHWVSVESHQTSVGFPDLDYCFSGNCGQLELKYGNIDTGKVPELRPSQVGYMRKRHEAQGTVHILLRVDGYHANGDVFYGLIRPEKCRLLINAKDCYDWIEQVHVSWDNTDIWQGLAYYLSSSCTSLKTR